MDVVESFYCESGNRELEIMPKKNFLPVTFQTFFCLFLKIKSVMEESQEILLNSVLSASKISALIIIIS